MGLFTRIPKTPEEIAAKEVRRAEKLVRLQARMDDLRNPEAVRARAAYQSDAQSFQASLVIDNTWRAISTTLKDKATSQLNAILAEGWEVAHFSTSRGTSAQGNPGATFGHYVFTRRQP